MERTLFEIRLEYDVRREYYVISGESSVRYEAFILREFRRQYSVRLEENIV
jgi:hypothetical protein